MEPLVQVADYVTPTQLITDINLPFTPEEQTRLWNDFVEIVGQRVTIRILDTLSESQKKRYFKLKNRLASRFRNKEKAATTFSEFVRFAVPNLPDIVREEAEGYKKELVDRMKSMNP